MEANKILEKPNILYGFLTLTIEDYDKLKNKEREVELLNKENENLRSNFREEFEKQVGEYNQKTRDAYYLEEKDMKRRFNNAHKELEEEYNEKRKELNKKIQYVLNHIGNMGLFYRIFYWD